MRCRRLGQISALTIIILIGIALGVTNALEPEDWEDKWFKIKVTLKAACDDLNDSNQNLSKGSGKEAVWIYFDSVYGGGDEFASFLVSEDNGVWEAVPVTLTRILGSSNDLVLESDTIDVDDSENIIEVYYCIWVTAKEKKEALKSAKLTSVAGTLYVLETNESECYGNLALKGKLVNEDKVPHEVKDALP